MIYDSLNSGFEQGGDVFGWQDFSAGMYGDIAAQAYDYGAVMPGTDYSFAGWGTEDFPDLTIDEYPATGMMDTDPDIGAQYLSDNSDGYEGADSSAIDQPVAGDVSDPSTGIAGAPIEYHDVDANVPEMDFGSPQMTQTGIERPVEGADQSDNLPLMQQDAVPQEFYDQISDKIVSDVFNNPDYTDKQISDMLNKLYDNAALDASKLDAAIDRSQTASDIAKDVAGAADPNQAWSDRVSELQSLGKDPMDYVSKVNQDLTNTKNSDGSYSDRFVSLNSDGAASTSTQSNPLNDVNTVQSTDSIGVQNNSDSLMQREAPAQNVQADGTDAASTYNGDVVEQDPNSIWAEHSDDGIFVLPYDQSDFNNLRDPELRDPNLGDMAIPDPWQGQGHPDDGIAIDPHTANYFDDNTLTADANFGGGFDSGDWSDFENYQVNDGGWGGFGGGSFVTADPENYA